MIGFLKGRILEINDNQLLVDVHGVGYLVTVVIDPAFKLIHSGDEIELLIYTHTTQDGISLFGFRESFQKQVFMHVLSVSGIGPKAAVSLLSQFEPVQLIQAILSANVGALTAVSGIGKKTAERIIVELKDKFAKLYQTLGSVKSKSDTAKLLWEDERLGDVVRALQSLGYSDQISQKVVAKLSVTPSDTVQMLIKRSLLSIKETHT